MTKFLQKSFTVGMPGNRGNWPWSQPPCAEQLEPIETPFGKLVVDESIPKDEIHYKSGGVLTGKIVNIGTEEDDVIVEQGGAA